MVNDFNLVTRIRRPNTDSNGDLRTCRNGLARRGRVGGPIPQGHAVLVELHESPLNSLATSKSHVLKRRGLVGCHVRTQKAPHGSRAACVGETSGPAFHPGVARDFTGASSPGQLNATAAVG